MKTISAALKAHLQGDMTSIATCWKIQRQDGQIYGFTDCSQDINYAGVRYEASTGMTPSALATSSDLSVNTQEAQGVLTSETITGADLLAGKWDYASVWVFIVNYNDLTMGDMKLTSGKLGEVKQGRVNFQAEIRSLTQNLQQTLGQLVQPACTAELGDTRCKVNLAPFTISGVAVSSVQTQFEFTASSLIQGAGVFNNGIVTFTSGANAGTIRRVKTHALGGVITLCEETPQPITAGDLFTIVYGCNKSIADCSGVFNNIINFRGFPNLPGRDNLTSGA